MLHATERTQNICTKCTQMNVAHMLELSWRCGDFYPCSSFKLLCFCFSDEAVPFAAKEFLQKTCFLIYCSVLLHVKMSFLESAGIVFDVQ